MAAPVLLIVAFTLGILSRVEELSPGLAVGISTNGLWLLGAFVAGAASADRRRSALAGVAFLTAANGSYYAFMVLGEGIVPPLGTASWWFALGLGGGVVFGLAGHVARQRRSLVAVLLPAGVLVAEGISHLGRDVGATLELAAGLALPVAVARPRALAVGATAVMLLVALTGSLEPLLP